MPLLHSIRRFAKLLCTLLGLVLCAQIAQACPTCKDSITENYVQAYGWSIMFMMSMPFLIFGSLAGYFYYEVRKARKQRAEVSVEATDMSPAT